MNFKTHLGVYGLIVKDDKIVLINKMGGPYSGKLDLPGGTIEFSETPIDTLKRELNEEVGIDIKEFEIFDSSSVTLDFKYKDTLFKIHHIGIFYKILSYENDIKDSIKITDKNDDSMGAKYYDINSLRECDLSLIAKLEIEKLGYELKK